jgi:exosortase
VSSGSRFAWIVPGLLWLWLFAHLRVEWTLNGQYNYGWAVPFLGALLFYFRWQRQPAPDVTAGQATGATIAAWLILLLLLPVRAIGEANPDWRFLSWVLALSVAAFSLLTLFQIGGPRWLRHFAFPICFFLVAVPWPVQSENMVVQAMMRAVAYVAVEIAGWFGVGAYQLGNVIQLRNGFVGVDEACSGVKTLQAGIMVALVLGELLQLRTSRRAALFLVGCGWIFVCNVFRATTLMFLAANGGAAALNRWHDWIGMVALVSGMAGMLGLAWCWRSEPEKELKHHEERTPRNIRAVPWIALAWLVLIFVGTEIWYRAHERQLREQPAWEVRWPTGNDTVTVLPIPESTRVILRYDEAKSAAWEEPPGIRWWSFFAHWRPERAALQLVRSHSPEICLPATGRTFRTPRPDLNLRFGNVPIVFRSYEFEQSGKPLFVFVCIQEDKHVASRFPEVAEWNLRGRLRATWQGKRNLGQRLLEIAVLGFDEFGQATAALEKTTAEMLQVPTVTD